MGDGLRGFLLNSIDKLKDSDNIAHEIDILKDIVTNFCDNLESDFNCIRDALEDLAPHIEKVNDAYVIAEKCSCDLY
jgi:uncharacterized protein YjgD (DUF1641 family)